jgi:hypothetical protein
MFKERKMLKNRLSSLLGSQGQRGMSHVRSARLLLVSIVALFAVVAPQTALAATQPQIDTFHDKGSFTVDCGSFMARGDWTLDMRFTVYFDQTGNPIKTIAHNDWNNVYTNLNTGFTVKDPATFVNISDLETGSYKQAGEIFRMIIPGQGIFVQDIGVVVYDENGNTTFIGGQHEVLNGDWHALICTALNH